MITQDPPAIEKPSQSNCPKWLSRPVWQVMILIAGTVTILAGVIMLVMPGPGMLAIYAGLGILATEFIWAKQFFIWLKRWVKQTVMRVRVWLKQNWRRNSP